MRVGRGDSYVVKEGRGLSAWMEGQGKLNSLRGGGMKETYFTHGGCREECIGGR